MDDTRRSDPRSLVRAYVAQLAEAGEEEIYLSPDAVALVRQETPAGAARYGAAVSPGARSGGREASARPTAEPGGREASTRPGRQSSVREKSTSSAGESERPRTGNVEDLAALLPEPEVVKVRLALGPGSADPDMFSDPSPLTSCGSLAEVERVAVECEQCELAATRTNVVFGTGSPDADLMFVGEAPGANEDLEGIPFVGRAGALLDKILDAAHFRREDVYIGNILKCRPPNNRTPLSSEIEACVPFLARQIEFIAPRIICTLGLPATQTLLGLRGSMASLRGKIYTDGKHKVIPTYHPAAALRDPKYKRPLWEDFLLLRREFDRL